MSSVAFKTVGLIGSFVISSALVPQMRKVYKTKSAKDISLLFQVLYVVGLGMILIYGFGESLWPIYIPATVEELAAVTMLCMKLYYDRRSTKMGAAGGDESRELELGISSRASSHSDAKFTGMVRTPQ
ncbi:hypothetical protein BBJ28_00020789 [Nothophytophthora sp. Chile5]|nr:hypothetical protein BBJ28_00020789 [Nothophytophthora sp. Chile5]